VNAFDASDYERLHELVFRSDYPGYTPKVKEDPNRDGHVDAKKRYAHVAAKYLQSRPRGYGELAIYLDLAMMAAREECVLRGAPEPGPDSTLRVLEYPPGASGGIHTDFDLFTLNLWRNVPNPGLPPGFVHMGELGTLFGLGAATPHYTPPMKVTQQSLVFFVIPDYDLLVPGTTKTVGAWVERQKKAARV
jgi:hypothetical protein